MGIRMTIKDTDAVTLEELLAQLPHSQAAKEVALLKKHGDAWEKVAKDFSKKIGELKSTLEMVSGCQNDHGTPKLCDGCMIEIEKVLAE